MLDADTSTPSSITAHAPGFIDRESELIVGSQTDAPLKRAIMPAGGLRMVEAGLAAYGYELDPAVREIFTRYRKTALDTSGYLGARASDTLLADTDLVLLDIKSWNPTRYRRLTTVDLTPTLAFARRLSDMDKPMWVRYVPFHKLGAAKYANMGIPFPLAHTPTPEPDLVRRVRDQFARRGITTTWSASSIMRSFPSQTRQHTVPNSRTHPFDRTDSSTQITRPE